MNFPSLVVYCVDVGSVATGRFGWARGEADGTQIEEDRGGGELLDVVTAIADDLARDRPVALGFECPLFIPIPEDHHQLGKARVGEHDRSWSAGAGPASLATGLAQEAWILAELANRVRPVTVTVDWRRFQAHPQGLFLWEAFVARKAKKPTHADDAATAVSTFRDTLPDLDGSPGISGGGRVVSLVGAAALWSGITDDVALMRMPCVVLVSD